MKAINLLMFLLFGVSAAVQYNDPDPLAWILAYAVAAIACLLSVLGRLPSYLPIAIGTLAFVWIGFLVPQLFEVSASVQWEEIFQVFRMTSLSVELWREIGGLLIILLWMIVLIRANRTR